MYWRDYKTEKPTALTVCLVEMGENTNTYEILTYMSTFAGDKLRWYKKQCLYEDTEVSRWTPLADIIKNIKDEPNSFVQEAQDNAKDFKDRLAVEYWQLSIRIEKLEKALITADFFDDKQKELLHEQRKAMLDYKDVLFRRCCLNEVDLYKHSFTCKAAPEGKL